jgi:hypothetical protein
MERKCSGFGRCIALTAIGGVSAQGVPLGPAYIGGVRVKCWRSVAYGTVQEPSSGAARLSPLPLTQLYGNRGLRPR